MASYSENNNQNNVDFSLNTESNDAQHRCSIEVQQINRTSPSPARDSHHTNRRLTQLTSNRALTNNLAKKPPIVNSSVLRKSISPRRRNNASLSLLNTGNSRIKTSSRSPVKTGNRKVHKGVILKKSVDSVDVATRSNQTSQENIESIDYDDEDDDDEEYDNDDSLLDVESIGKQTPFRSEYHDGSGAHFAVGASLATTGQNEESINQTPISSRRKKQIDTQEKQEEKTKNRFSLIEFEYLFEDDQKTNDKQGDISSRFNQTTGDQLLLDESMKIQSFNETDTLDEILLIADDGKVENLEEEYKKFKEQEKEERRLRSLEKEQSLFHSNTQNDFDLLTLESDALDQQFLIDLPAHILEPYEEFESNIITQEKQQTQTGATGRKTPSRIPTPVRGTSVLKNRPPSRTGFLQSPIRPPSPGLSKIPVLKGGSRPGSRLSEPYGETTPEKNRKSVVKFSTDQPELLLKKNEQEESEAYDAIDSIAIELENQAVEKNKIETKKHLISENQNKSEPVINTKVDDSGGGAFKFYSNFDDDDLLSNEPNLFDDNNDESISYSRVIQKLSIKDEASGKKDQPPLSVLINEEPKKEVKSEKQVLSIKSQSPFISIERQETTLEVSKNISPKQQNNQRNSRQISKTPTPQNKKNTPSKKLLSKSNTEQINPQPTRPPTTTEVAYSFDSEDASITENSKKDLKSKLKQEQKSRKQTKELLDELQNNYNMLLEKHAQAENVIDNLRLQAKLQVHQDHTPNGDSQSGTLIILNKGQLSSNSSIPQIGQIFNMVGDSTRKSNSKETVNGEVSRLVGNALLPFQTTHVGSSITNTPSNFYSETQSNNGRQEHQTVPSIQTAESEQILSVDVEKPLEALDTQQSKLGLLIQTKLLEDKMQSFITLMDEKQLSVPEQRQIYDTIKQDYEMLVKNYKDAKKNDPNGFLPNELDIDIDLNKELEKMKDLLNDIVKKLTDNLIGQSPSGSIAAPDRRQSHHTTSSVSSYGNHDDIMNQYNRLLEMFNSSTNRGNQEELMKQLSILDSTITQYKKSDTKTQMNNETNNFKQSLTSLITTATSNAPTSNVQGSVNDLISHDNDEDDLKKFRNETLDGQKPTNPDNYIDLSEDVEIYDDEEQLQNYLTNKMYLTGNKKSNNKTLSKISSSVKQSNNDYESEKPVETKTSTNLVVSNSTENKKTIHENPSTRIESRNGRSSSDYNDRLDRDIITINGRTYVASSDLQSDNSNVQTIKNDREFVRNKRLSALKVTNEQIAPRSYEYDDKTGRIIKKSSRQSSRENSETRENEYRSKINSRSTDEFQTVDEHKVGGRGSRAVERQRKRYESELISNEYDELNSSRNSPSMLKTRSELDSGLGSQSAIKSRKKKLNEKQKELRKIASSKKTSQTRSSDDRDHDFDNLSRNQVNQKMSKEGNLPVAKAYEGSDSDEEDLDYLDVQSKRQLEAARENRNGRLDLETNSRLHSDKKDYRMSRHMQMDDETFNNDIPSKIKNKNLRNKNSLDKYEELDKEISIIEDSDASSVIYRKKPSKVSKSEIMDQLSEEVESLKQKIIDKQTNKTKQYEPKHQKFSSYQRGSTIFNDSELVSSLTSLTMTDNSLQKYKNQFDHKSYDSLPENVRKSERYFEQKLQNKKPKIVKITPKSSLRAKKRTIRVYDSGIVDASLSGQYDTFYEDRAPSRSQRSQLTSKSKSMENLSRRSPLEISSNKRTHRRSQQVRSDRQTEDNYEPRIQKISRTPYDSPLLRKPKSTTSSNSALLREEPISKRRGVYFEDEIPFDYDNNDSIASLHNVRIPAEAMAIVRNRRGELIYLDAENNVIDVKKPKKNSRKTGRKLKDSRTYTADLSLEVPSYLDSGYATISNSRTKSDNKDSNKNKRLSYNERNHVLPNSIIFSGDQYQQHEFNDLNSRLTEFNRDPRQAYMTESSHNPREHTRAFLIEERTDSVRSYPQAETYLVHDSRNLKYPSYRNNLDPYKTRAHREYPLSVIDTNVERDPYSIQHDEQQRLLSNEYKKRRLLKEEYLKHLINQHQLEHPTQQLRIGPHTNAPYVQTFRPVSTQIINPQTISNVESIPNQRQAIHSAQNHLNIPSKSRQVPDNKIERDLLVPNQALQKNTNHTICPICDHMCVHKSHSNLNITSNMIYVPRKKVRYYIREYGDATSDNDIIYNHRNL